MAPIRRIEYCLDVSFMVISGLPIEKKLLVAVEGAYESNGL